MINKVTLAISVLNSCGRVLAQEGLTIDIKLCGVERLAKWRAGLRPSSRMLHLDLRGLEDHDASEAVLKSMGCIQDCYLLRQVQGATTEPAFEHQNVVCD